MPSVSCWYSGPGPLDHSPRRAASASASNVRLLALSLGATRAEPSPMSATTTDPIAWHWTPSTDRATATELVGRLATIELSELGRHRRALAVAVDDLHSDADSNQLSIGRAPARR